MIKEKAVAILRSSLYGFMCWLTRGMSLTGNVSNRMKEAEARRWQLLSYSYLQRFMKKVVA